MGILPADLLAATEGTGLDIAAILEPAREVGGDLYEVLAPRGRPGVRGPGRRLRQGHPGRALHGGDHDPGAHDGPPARRPGGDPAPRERRAGGPEPAQHVRDPAVRGVRPAEGPRDRGLGRPPPGDRVVGREPPRQAFSSTGRVAGLMLENEVTSESMDLRPGDTLLFFSDGVNEAFDEAQDLLGDERLLAHLPSGRAGPRPRPSSRCSASCGRTPARRSSPTTSRSSRRAGVHRRVERGPVLTCLRPQSRLRSPFLSSSPAAGCARRAR